MSTAGGNPLRQLAQRGAPNRGLHFTQAPVCSKRVVQPAKSRRMWLAVDLVVILAMVFVGPHAPPKFFGVGGYHTTLARRGHDLVLAERECRNIAKRAHRSAFVGCAVPLRAI